MVEVLDGVGFYLAGPLAHLLPAGSLGGSVDPRVMKALIESQEIRLDILVLQGLPGSSREFLLS